MREILARSDFKDIRRSKAPNGSRGRETSTFKRQDKRRSTPIPASLSLRLRRFLLSVSKLVLSLATEIIRRYPAAVGGSVIGGGIAIAIIINATFLQEGRHPAPLFSASQTKPTSIPLPSSHPLKFSALPDNNLKITQDDSHVIPPKRHETASAPNLTDPIAQLLATGQPPVEGKQVNISSIQKALAKLGYEVALDGLMGPSTRQAIISFEKVEGLPQTGDPMNAAMRKALSVASGIALD